LCQKVIRSDCSLLRQGLRVQPQLSVISDFRREVAENCALLGYCTARSGNFLPTFRDKLSAPSSGSRIQKKTCTGFLCREKQRSSQLQLLLEINHECFLLRVHNVFSFSRLYITNHLCMLYKAINSVYKKTVLHSLNCAS